MALIRASAPLSKQLERVLPSRPFHVRFWDGGTRAGDGAELRRRSSCGGPSALAHFLRAPGTLGLGRAYVDGSLAVDDLDAAFVVVDSGSRRRCAVADRVRLGARARGRRGPGRDPASARASS